VGEVSLTLLRHPDHPRPDVGIVRQVPGPVVGFALLPFLDVRLDHVQEVTGVPVMPGLRQRMVSDVFGGEFPQGLQHLPARVGRLEALYEALVQQGFNPVERFGRAPDRRQRCRCETALE
jgi:hypothetical protein